MQQALGAHVLVVARAECELLDFTITNGAIHSLLRVFLFESRIFPEISLDNWKRVAFRVWVEKYVDEVNGLFERRSWGGLEWQMTPITWFFSVER